MSLQSIIEKIKSVLNYYEWNEDDYIKITVAEAKELLSHLEAEKWVSVKERLPEERVRYCLCFNGDAPEYNQHIFVAAWFAQDKRFRKEEGDIYRGKITHWMPLPPKP